MMTPNVWVWVGLSWTERIRMVLENYGDRLTDASIFGWRVGSNGALEQTFDPSLLDVYRAKWPHLRFWLCFRNDGVGSVFTALRNDETARARLMSDLGDVIDAHPWLHGIDIDLEQGGAASNNVAAEALFKQVADLAHGRNMQASAALPALTSTGSVGGEDWVTTSNSARSWITFRSCPTTSPGQVQRPARCRPASGWKRFTTGRVHKSPRQKSVWAYRSTLTSGQSMTTPNRGARHGEAFQERITALGNTFQALAHGQAQARITLSAG